MSDASRTMDRAELIRRAIDDRLCRVHTMLPGRVESYNPGDQTADVRIAIDRLELAGDGEEISEPLPVIPDVPVAHPRGGQYFAAFPLVAGDSVMLLFAERSIDNWFAGDGEPVNPDVLHQHDFSDAVAYPGFYPLKKKLANAKADKLVVGHDNGTAMFVDESLINLGAESAAEFVALAAKTLTELQSIVTQHNAHVHVETGTTTQTPSVPMTNPASVAASKVKAE